MNGALMMIDSAVILVLMDARLAGVLFSTSKVTADQNNSVARLTARLTQLFSNIRLVKSFTAEEPEQKRASAEIDQLYRHSVRAAGIVSLLQPIVTLAMGVALVAIFL